MRNDFTFWMTIPTRWRDMDAMKHVNSTVYFTYFEAIRMAYFRQINLNDIRQPGKLGPAVISQTCNYRDQIFHPSQLDAGIRTTTMSTKSFTVEYEIYLKDTDRLMCDGNTVMVWVDYIKTKAVPMPERLRQGIFALEGREF